MYRPKTVANYFIYKSIGEGVRISPMKVLKLVYIANGWHLGLDREPLLTEQTEAWRYGPVIQSVYKIFKKFGQDDIDALQFHGNEDRLEFKELLQDHEAKAFLDKIWDVYKDYSGPELSALTHQHGTPWDITWHKEGGSLKKGAIIPNSLIEDYYRSKVKKNKVS